MSRATQPRLLAFSPAAALLVMTLAPPSAWASCDGAGAWTLQVHWPQRTANVELRVSFEDETVKVVWNGPQGELEGRDPHCSGDSLDFDLEVESERHQAVTLHFEARVDDDELEGSLRLPNGKQVTVEGRRQPPS